MRLTVALPLIATGAALLGACHSDLNQPSTGSIETLVTGLPAGVAVTMEVTGPDGFTGSITQNGSLTGLAPGTYTIAAPPVTDAPHVYSTTSSQIQVDVTADNVSNLTFEYALVSGLLELTLNGIPVTLQGAVVVTGPDAFNQTLGTSGIVSGLSAGSYSVLAAPIDSSGHAFAALADLQGIDVVPSTDPIPVAVDYQLATGRAVINISGLPGGVPGSVAITGPENFSTNLTASQTLIKLAPGTYSIAVDDVLSGGHTFSAADTILNVVPNRIALQATVGYQQVTGELRIQVSGLPTGVNSAVSVTGPNDFSQAITRSDTLVGLEPGAYTLAADSVNSGGFIYEPLDFDQSLNVQAGAAATVAVAYAFTGSSSLDLTIPQVYFVQSVQRSEGDVPLVAGRDALARVFVLANETNSVLPDVRLRLYHDGSLVETFTMTADRANTPISISEQTTNASWNALVPGDLIVDGLSADIVVDPGNGVPELNESNNAFPANGQLPIDVRTLPAFAITLVPVQQAPLTGGVSAANADQFLDDTWRMFPTHQIDWEIHPTFTTSAPTLMSGDQNDAWGTVLSEIRSLRIAESGTAYYYGVVRVNYNSGVAGLGYVPTSPTSQSKAAIGWDHLPSGSEVLAHELGHNFGRRHAPCGGPAGVDPSYPYANAAIGHFGFDIVSGVVMSSGRPDIMSYCNNPWVSDYTYEGIFARREAEAAFGAQSSIATTTSLLVWGRIRDDSIVLEPAFEIEAAPVLPANVGPYLLEGLGPNGETAFAYRFTGDEVADLPGGNERHFAFLIPLSDRTPPLQTLRVSGAGLSYERQSLTAGAPALDPVDTPLSMDGSVADRVRLQWDASSMPMVLVRDPDTGQILSFARGGDATVWTNRLGVELNMSDGVRSATRTVRR